jgi:RNA polymerase sigma-70 factor, ECF subfamily
LSILKHDRGIQSDNKLVEKARNGDAKAFGDLICRYHTSCLNMATSILRDRSEAQDEVQKAYWRAYERLYQYRNESNIADDRGQRFLAWLLRIVRNQCLMLIRVKRRMPFVHIDAGNWFEGSRPVELPANEANAEKKLLQQEMIEVLQKEIRCIPPLLRKVLLLCDMEEMPMTEVAERLQITVPAAKSRLLRARKELRERVTVYCNFKQRGNSSLRGSRQMRLV